MFDQLKVSTFRKITLLRTAFPVIKKKNFCSDERDCQSFSFKSLSNLQKKVRYMKSPVTIGSFDLTTRHDLIMHIVGLRVNCSLRFWSVLGHE